MKELKTHLAFVRENSPFYREFWSDAWTTNGAVPDLGDLPVTDHTAYWSANTPVDNRVLTGSHENGIIFKSGGTTGDPKYSFFSADDWRGFCHVFGQGMRRAGLREGERVANLFYGGQLYASLLFIGRCIEESGVGVNFPLAGFTPPDEIVNVLKKFRVETLAGIPTTLVNLLPHLAAAGPEVLNIKRCLYGGETFYPDQIAALQRVLPGCEVCSVGIAGVDYGELGWVDGQCERGVHRVFDESAVLEILDEDSRPVDEPGVPGELHLTNFRRRLMPVIRYPAGDRGMWVDPPGVPGRRFKLLGRTDKGARIGPLTLYMEDVRRIVSEKVKNALGFQLIIEHVDQRDLCTLRIAVPDPDTMPDKLVDDIIAVVYLERKMYPDLVRDGIVHPLKVVWVDAEGLDLNPRTGKLMLVIDKRNET